MNVRDRTAAQVCLDAAAEADENAEARGLLRLAARYVRQASARSAAGAGAAKEGRDAELETSR